MWKEVSVVGPAWEGRSATATVMAGKARLYQGKDRDYWQGNRIRRTHMKKTNTLSPQRGGRWRIPGMQTDLSVLCQIDSRDGGWVESFGMSRFHTANLYTLPPLCCASGLTHACPGSTAETFAGPAIQPSTHGSRCAITAWALSRALKLCAHCKQCSSSCWICLLWQHASTLVFGKQGLSKDVCPRTVPISGLKSEASAEAVLYINPSSVTTAEDTICPSSHWNCFSGNAAWIHWGESAPTVCILPSDTLS